MIGKGGLNKWVAWPDLQAGSHVLSVGSGSEGARLELVEEGLFQQGRRSSCREHPAEVGDACAHVDRKPTTQGQRF